MVHLTLDKFKESELHNAQFQHYKHLVSQSDHLVLVSNASLIATNFRHDTQLAK